MDVVGGSCIFAPGRPYIHISYAAKVICLLMVFTIIVCPFEVFYGSCYLQRRDRELGVEIRFLATWYSLRCPSNVKERYALYMLSSQAFLTIVDFKRSVDFCGIVFAGD